MKSPNYRLIIVGGLVIYKQNYLRDNSFVLEQKFGMEYSVICDIIQVKFRFRVFLLQIQKKRGI